MGVHPVSAGKYFYCSDKASRAYNGCRAYAMGEFPLADCAAQCVHGSDELPPICPDGVGTKCPADGEPHVLAGRIAQFVAHSHLRGDISPPNKHTDATITTAGQEYFFCRAGEATGSECVLVMQPPDQRAE